MITWLRQMLLANVQHYARCGSGEQDQQRERHTSLWSGSRFCTRDVPGGHSATDNRELSDGAMRRIKAQVGRQAMAERAEPSPMPARLSAIAPRS